MINLTNLKINAGLEQPVKLLHITDTHLTFATKEDSDYHQDAMVRRFKTFYDEGGQPPFSPQEYLKQAVELSSELNALLVNTGDMIDLFTKGNVIEFKKILDGVDMMFTPGGHEFQKRFVRTMEEEYPHIEETRPKVQEVFKEHNLDLTSRVINGLNVVCADNSLDYYSPKTLELFKKELEKGLPIIVFSHDPIWDRMLEHTEPYHPNVRLTPEDYKASHEMIDLLLNHPLVLTTIGGHNHVNMEKVINGKTHYTTAGLFKGVARLIEIV